MSDSHPTSSAKSVFQQIEDALGASAHGRAFLEECERRVRSREAASLLDAVARLERRARHHDADVDREELFALVSQVEAALRDANVAFMHSVAVENEAGQQSLASFGQDTTSAIVSAVEVIQEIGWKLREAGVEPALCDELDDHTRAIYGACQRQDRMLDGLGTVERAIRRAGASVADLRRFAMPWAMAAPLENRDPISLIDSDIEFVVRRDDGSSDRA